MPSSSKTPQPTASPCNGAQSRPDSGQDRRGPRPDGRGAPPHWLRVLGVWAGAAAVSLLILRLGARDTPETVWAPASPTWTDHISFWDSGWYNRISSEGYPTDLPVDANGRVAQNSWAFMPLLPALARVLGWTGWSFYVCAALVATAASAGAAVVMDRWLAPTVGERASLWAVALAWSSPCAAVLQMPYAESLSLLLTAAALALAGRGRFALAVPAIALAAFSRPIGLPLTMALGAWWLWEVARDRLPAARNVRLLPGSHPLDRREREGLLGLTVFSAACTLAWPMLAWLVTGRPDAYTATETAWRDGSLMPFAPWWDRSEWWVGVHLGWLLLAGILVAAIAGLSAPSLRRLGPAAWFWCAGYVVYLLMFFDPTASIFRILLPLAPAAWALALSSSPRRRLVLLAAGVIGQLFWISWVWDASIAVRWVP